MRFFYSLLWWLILPFALAKIWRRGAVETGYRKHVWERLGIYRHFSDGIRPPLIWVHAVSVGETRAAQPLIDALMAEYPDHSLLLTHMSVTGRATGQQLYSHYGQRFVQSYMPYDLDWMAARFLRYFQPKICILMETEVWPNMVAQCDRRRVPIALVNGRLSEKSLRRGQRFAGLLSDAAKRISLVAAQTAEDAARFKLFGAHDIHVTGSLKFDVAPPADIIARGQRLREQIGVRSVLLCASTREGEEALILSAFDALDKASWGNTLLIIAPRHPQRFDEVAKMALTYPAMIMQRRSNVPEGAPISPQTKILLGDTMGEMFAYYEACDVAFIGGSLVPLGGQNFIEATVLGKPVLIGTHTFNFSQSTEDAVNSGVAVRVQDAADIFRITAEILRSDERQASMHRASSQFMEQFKGATARLMELLDPLLNPSGKQLPLY
jgi:3-deoxy-D-manno-octulosonic-acid transferase